MMALKESQICTRAEIRREHSEAQLPDRLTQAAGQLEYYLFYKMGPQ